MFQESNFDTADKRNSNEYLPQTQQYQMPNPTSWNIHDLNWNFDGVQRQNQNITHFTAFTNTCTTTTPPPTVPGKRKTIEPCQSYRPTKQFISEQKMIEHMSSMHLSSNFTNHNISPDTFEDTTYKVFLSPKDLEEKLRNAQRITVCEQIKNLTKDDPLLPKALLDKANGSTINPPYCSALVLWQPPSQILKVNATEKAEEEEEKRPKRVETVVNQMESEELFMDNNNSSSVDFNSLPGINDVDMDDL